MKKQKYYFIFTLFIFLLGHLSTACAAKIIIEQKDGKYDSLNTVLEVRLDPEGKILNVVEGEINLLGGTNETDVKVDTNDSGISMWPTPAVYVDSEKAIHFVGGTPNGFSSEILVFSIVLTSKNQSNISVNFKNGAAYINDGLGTKVSLADIHTDILVSSKKESSINIRFIEVIGVIILLLVVFFVFQLKRKRNEI